MKLTHSKGEPDVPPSTTCMNVRFARLFTMNLPIRHLMKNSATAKKTGRETTQIHPALFQMAARLDISGSIRKDAPSPVSTPFVDLTLDKGKLETILNSAQSTP